jgi:aminocarboxymuconate-semialdehyde decarboxylase
MPEKLPKKLVVDFHAHILEPHVLRASAGRTVVTGFGAIAEPPRTPGSRRDIWFKQMMDPEAHLEGLDKMGVDVAVISSSTVIQNTAWADSGTGLELDRHCNDMIADWVRRYPGRFVGTFTMPMKDQHLSLREMERAVKELGLRIANLPANVEGVYLGEPRFRPFWEAVNELGVIVFIHPDGVLDPWFQKYSLWNSVGQPIEEAKVMSSLIYEGVLEAFPDLKIVMAHGGGYMPHYHGRLDRNVKNRPDTMANIKHEPSWYLKRFYYDTCVYDPMTLDNLIERVGADRILMGSDFPVGETDPVGFLKRCKNVDGRAFAQISGETACAMLGIPAER